MNDKFTEKQLSFGKILVLEQGHELSEMDIKAFSNASSVEKISITSLMASPNSPTRGHPKFPQAAPSDYDVSGLTTKRAAASLSL